jgi:hypothetical protein
MSPEVSLMLTCLTLVIKKPCFVLNIKTSPLGHWEKQWEICSLVSYPIISFSLSLSCLPFLEVQLEVSSLTAQLHPVSYLIEASQSLLSLSVVTWYHASEPPRKLVSMQISESHPQCMLESCGGVNDFAFLTSSQITLVCLFL